MTKPVKREVEERVVTLAYRLGSKKLLDAMWKHTWENVQRQVWREVFLDVQAPATSAF